MHSLVLAFSQQVSSRCSYLVLNHSLGMVYFCVSLFMAWISMLLLASRTFNSLMTQVMLPILASIWCFCSASFSTSLSPRSRLSPAALLKRMELNVLDASNNIDIQAMKRDTQKYTMPSEWFKTKYEPLLDTCYEMAPNLPAEIAENSVV